jgi:sterol desaturase/sphingolipid hydroxylase (fatty acid hydroxylase superfamily)
VPSNVHKHATHREHPYRILFYHLIIFGSAVTMSVQWEIMACAGALLCVGIDFYVRRFRRERGYQTADTLCSIGIGLGYFAAWILARAAVLALFYAVSQVPGILKLIPDGPIGWLITLVGVDLGYYWYHRALHATNAGWAAHAVHHSSRYFNYATALRGSFIEPFLEPWFHCWLLLLGADPLAVIGAIAVNHAYQFWLHTDVVDRLALFEFFLVTPSHHRVHHACNPQYLDRNFGAMLIIWDRIFGTYACESTEPRYGLVKPIRSARPLTVALWPLLRLAIALQRQRSKRAMFRYLVSRPQ